MSFCHICRKGHVSRGRLFVMENEEVTAKNSLRDIKVGINGEI